jgi:membrane-bound lytic murein transglycosylase MltF
MMAGPLPVTLELQKYLDFTLPIYTSRFLLIQAKTATQENQNLLRNQLELNGQEIVVPCHAPSVNRLRRLAAEISIPIRIKEVKVTEYDQLIQWILSGSTQYVVMDEYQARAYAKQYPIDISTPVSFPQFQAWGIKIGTPTLRDSLNHFLNEYKTTEAFKALKEKYGLVHTSE